VNKVEAELIIIKSVVKRHPACDVICVSRRNNITPNILCRQGKYTPRNVLRSSVIILFESMKILVLL